MRSSSDKWRRGCRDMSGMKEANCHLTQHWWKKLFSCVQSWILLFLTGKWTQDPLAGSSSALCFIFTRLCTFSSESQRPNVMLLHQRWTFSLFKCSMVENMWEDFAIVVVFTVEAPARSEITQEFKQRSRWIARCMAKNGRRGRAWTWLLWRTTVWLLYILGAHALMCVRVFVQVCVSHGPQEDNVNHINTAALIPASVCLFHTTGYWLAKKVNSASLSACWPWPAVLLFFSNPPTRPPPHFTWQKTAEANKEEREGMGRSTLCTYTPQGELCSDELLPQNITWYRSIGGILSFKLSFLMR